MLELVFYSGRVLSLSAVLLDNVGNCSAPVMRLVTGGRSQGWPHLFKRLGSLKAFVHIKFQIVFSFLLSYFANAPPLGVVSVIIFLLSASSS